VTALKKFLSRRANHLHNFKIENSSSRRETGRGLFQSDGDRHSRSYWAHILPIDIRDRLTAVINLPGCTKYPQIMGNS
jgi:hypothetical protein